MNAKQALGRQWQPRSPADLEAQARRVRENNAKSTFPRATLRELRTESLRADTDD